MTPKDAKETSQLPIQYLLFSFKITLLVVFVCVENVFYFRILLTNKLFFTESRVYTWEKRSMLQHQVLSCFSISGRKFSNYKREENKKKWNKYVFIFFYLAKWNHVLWVHVSSMTTILCARVRIAYSFAIQFISWMHWSYCRCVSARECHRGCNFKWFHKDGDILYDLILCAFARCMWHFQ